MRSLFISAACLVTVVTSAQTKRTPQLGVDPVREVVAAMTLDEKLSLIHGTGMRTAASADGTIVGSEQGRVPGAAGSTFAIPRLGIPSIIMADGPAGLRIDTLRANDPKRYYTTAYPTGTILASTWNTELLREVGNVMGNEVREYGVDILLAPGINIQRNLLCGRNYEYYSEDPYLTGCIGTAFVNGMQEQGVGVSVKHFAANNQETNRSAVNSVVSQRALREIYLRAFEMIVKEAAPWTVMSAYNKLNGQYASENKNLLTTVLRDDWGFKGIVVTDWFAGKNYVNQVLAGNDLLMPGRMGAEDKKIKKALEAGGITEADIDKNVERILNLIMKCPRFKEYAYSNNPDLKAHAEVARRAATEGIVLLKNETNSLPIKKGKLAVFGNASYETYIGGTGSGEVNKAYFVSVVEGLASAGYELDSKITSLHKTYIKEERAKQPERTNLLQKINNLPEMCWSKEDLTKMAEESVAAIITIGRNAGEGEDRTVEVDYLLNESEKNLISSVAEAFHAVGKQVVVILNIDGIIEVSSWQDLVDGILIAWLPGQEAGNAMADIVSGEHNPSGKLAITIPVKYEDIPSASTFPGVPVNRPDSTVYNEGIYVGYRYANTYDVKPAYEFGFGLSYTSFKISKLKLNSKSFDGNITAQVTVQNTGKRAGKEVVQLYLSAPIASIDKPTEELKAFTKTRLLQPGEKQTISFTLNARDLASFYMEQSAWIADEGTYTVKIGNSSRNFSQTASFVLKNTLEVERVNNLK